MLFSVNFLRGAYTDQSGQSAPSQLFRLARRVLVCVHTLNSLLAFLVAASASGGDVHLSYCRRRTGPVAADSFLDRTDARGRRAGQSFCGPHRRARVCSAVARAHRTGRHGGGGRRKRTRPPRSDSKPGEKHVVIRSIVDQRAPKLPIVWGSAGRNAGVRDAQRSARLRLRTLGAAPVMASVRRGAGAALWIATSPGKEGTNDFPTSCRR